MDVAHGGKKSYGELYAKVGSTPLTALKTSSKCSFIPYKLRFLVSSRLVRKHDPTFAWGSGERKSAVALVGPLPSLAPMESRQLEICKADTKRRMGQSQ
uniref:Uncharacterized protein n=1 Tax=Candidatus Kentrum sp. DK TaxID=2126562 RepID=A0A450RZK0_9GAMM|nr:MAG: hypothetical protein BECKDK2373C_GA0170839_100921 [Candidatus Kentron sp. DK]VFJ44871.1 MAG: hypothetical protein BECKDK2373B_GA0170837_100831 [Candidatus Kentron sp. DK]